MNKYTRLKDSYKRQNSECRLHCSSAQERFSRALRTRLTQVFDTKCFRRLAFSLQSFSFFSDPLILLMCHHRISFKQYRIWFSNCALRSLRALQKRLRVTRGRAPTDSRLKGGNRVSTLSVASTALVLTLFIYWGPPGLQFKMAVNT